MAEERKAAAVEAELVAEHRAHTARQLRLARKRVLDDLTNTSSTHVTMTEHETA